ncbi:ergothioneine biosynthesis protein EgtB [Cytophagaceae bacterium DM2B3-1]|uniref:Ergothioneine biosynthesis protein EgtB n=1 Tax=Xanthocytophaga flava TaxID=3048013 RepID=A0ABT7CFP2_9BACT|nr:ergothioneine biosynthesis protein EgtB [Xanthocytophaga flavus]MDJ1492557.1 ergothioneine biosynthesis protein EgtB [Xanthocytophaga flavus]
MNTVSDLVQTSWLARFKNIRQRTAAICQNLTTEDYVVQPIADVSPAKWHLGHTTWFFETFLLVPYLKGYQVFHPDFSFVFNSYYETVGKRVLRTDRGNLTRPTVEEVYAYRTYVDTHLEELLLTVATSDFEQREEFAELLEIGFNHEEQHQELLVTDLKYILGHNPLFPAVKVIPDELYLYNEFNTSNQKVYIEEGVYEIGHRGNGFSFDNELGRHKVYLPSVSVSPKLITNAEFMEFMEAGGYQNFNHWLAEGWDWVKQHQIQAPLYWHKIEGSWWNYTFEGLQPVNTDDAVCHVSFYEADAFARWKGQRLLTEFEWEIAAQQFVWGQRWEWTNSAYLAYPGFAKAEGAVGEYNGKFMINQMVLRGASAATPPQHSRITYRNFFQTDKRWQFTGIRLVQNF